MIRDAISVASPPPQVERLLKVLTGEMSRGNLLTAMGLTDRRSFRKRYLAPAINEGLIEMTRPDKPNSRLQKYRLTGKGRQWLAGSGAYDEDYKVITMAKLVLDLYVQAANRAGFLSRIPARPVNPRIPHPSVSGGPGRGFWIYQLARRRARRYTAGRILVANKGS